MDNPIARIMQKDSIFKVGEVFSVNGREVKVRVDKTKNLTHMMYCGELIKNVVVGGYIKILKGFVQLVAKVDGEYIQENKKVNPEYHNTNEVIDRILIVQLIGYIENGNYYKGVKELPLIGNDCLLMDNAEFALIHRFAKSGESVIRIGSLMSDDRIPINIGINKFFSSHIGIFGNTGSGKSYTLANVYRNLFLAMNGHDAFHQNAKFLLFDFNGEYSDEHVIIEGKKIYNLNTRNNNGSRIPLKKVDLLNPELVNILASATEKTQQPFIKRTLQLYEHVHNQNAPIAYLQGIVKNEVERVLRMTDYLRAKQLLDYLDEILPPNMDPAGINVVAFTLAMNILMLMV